MSGVRLNVQEFGEQCKTEKKSRKESTEVLHKNNQVCQRDSVSDVSTIEYLNQFRCEAGYTGSNVIQQQGLSVFGYKPYVATDEEQNISRDTLDENKIGLEGQRNPDGYSFTFTSVKLSGRDLENTSSVMSNYCNLRSIDISDNCIKSIRNLGAMPYLQCIDASKNQISTFLDISPVPVALKEVDFSYNMISSIVNMKNFWSLTDINLSHNELTVIEGLSDLEFLQVLNLSYNKIDTIVDLDCPNLLILYLNHNNLTAVSGFLNCNNLRYMNLNGNKISTLKGLQHMNELTELQIADNNIQDMSELENLKTILTLTRIRIDSNPISSLENWRLVLIHMLPGILWMDGQSLKAEELRMAENIFSPSYKKIAFVDHAAILLDRACQAANHVFDEHCRTRPFPPVLLLVGTPKSQCHRMALLLKEKFRNKVYLGGVHSTATTMEGSCPNSDIPVSYESFKEMKNRGEFLATSQILGRVCGFATSQIARAAEKGALLVATVPLTTAISLREWNLRPKLVLVLPSSKLEFPKDEERKETIRRSSLADLNTSIGSQKSLEEEEGDDEIERTGKEDPEKDHIVNFAEMLSVVPSLSKDLESMVYHEPQEPISLGAPQHSILKTPHFEMTDIYDKATLFDSTDSEGSSTDLETKDFVKSGGKLVPMASIQFHGDHGDEVDLEKKRNARLKSLAPGKERYPSLTDSDEDDEYEEVHEDNSVRDIDINESEIMEIHDNELVKSNAMENARAQTTTSSKASDEPNRTPEESAPRNVVSRPRHRLNRLASLLMLETDQRLDSSLNIADILMNLPSIEKVDPKLLQTVDLSTAQYPPDNTLTEHTDNDENALAVVPIEQEKRIQPPSALDPACFSFLPEPFPLRTAPIEKQGFVENSDLIEASEHNKELEAVKTDGVKASFDEAGVTSVGKEKHSIGSEKPSLGNEDKTNIHKNDDEEEREEEEEEEEEEDINEIPENMDAERGDSSTKKSQKCKHRHKKCKSRKHSQKQDSSTKNNTDNNDAPKSGESKRHRSCSGKHHHHKTKPVIDTKKSIKDEDGLPSGEHLDEEQKLLDDSNAPIKKAESPTNVNGLLDNGQEELATPKAEPNHKKKGLRFQGSDEEQDSTVEMEKSTEVATENAVQTNEPSPDVIAQESKLRSSAEVKKVKEAVRMVQSERFSTDEHEDHHLKHKEALKSSIMQTREEYAEFNWDNPGFFHTILDTSDLCSSFTTLENLAIELLLKYKKDSKVKDFLKASVKSHAGENRMDEKWFLAERMKHFKNCASVWSKGDCVNASVDRGMDNDDKVVKPCEIYFEKASCPKGLLDTSLPRPGITLKMKRIVELYEKKIRCSKKHC